MQNYMQRVLIDLGFTPGEIFIWDGVSYFINEDGVFEDKTNLPRPEILGQILLNPEQVKHTQWKPNLSGNYWAIQREWEVVEKTNNGSVYCLQDIICGNFFKSKHVALEASVQYMKTLKAKANETFKE